MEARGVIYVLMVTVFLTISWLVRILVSGRIHRKVSRKDEGKDNE